jgi:hypothetical protein
MCHNFSKKMRRIRAAHKNKNLNEFVKRDLTKKLYGDILKAN